MNVCVTAEKESRDGVCSSPVSKEERDDQRKREVAVFARPQAQFIRESVSTRPLPAPPLAADGRSGESLTSSSAQETQGSEISYSCVLLHTFPSN